MFEAWKYPWQQNFLINISSSKTKPSEVVSEARNKLNLTAMYGGSQGRLFILCHRKSLSFLSLLSELYWINLSSDSDSSTWRAIVA